MGVAGGVETVPPNGRADKRSVEGRKVYLVDQNSLRVNAAQVVVPERRAVAWPCEMVPLPTPVPPVSRVFPPVRVVG